MERSDYGTKWPQFLYTATDLSWQVILNDSSEKTDCLLACIYTQMDYQMSYRSLPKLVLDGWFISSKTGPLFPQAVLSDLVHVIAKHTNDIMTWTRPRQTNWNGGWFWRFLLRAKAGVPKTSLKQKLCLHSLYFSQNTLMLTVCPGEFSDLHSIFRLHVLCYSINLHALTWLNILISFGIQYMYCSWKEIFSCLQCLPISMSNSINLFGVTFHM